MRNGRPVDVVLAGKAQFKEGASVAGEVGTTMGTSLLRQGLLSNNANMANLGAGFALFGVIAQVAASAATPAADARYWDTLPGGISIATARLPKGVDSAKLQNKDMYLVAGKSCSVAWSFETSALNAGASAPNADPGRKLDSRRLQQDATFRASLLNDFLASPPAPPSMPMAVPIPTVPASSAAPVPTPISVNVPPAP